jgi:GNAT superfamily N-acetyltransferase
VAVAGAEPPGARPSPAIRPVRPTDLTAIVDLWNRTIGDRYPLEEDVLAATLERNPSRRPGDGIVAVDRADVAVGFGYLTMQRLPDRELETFRDRAHLQAVVVDPSRRRQGIGRAIVARLAAGAAGEGRTTIEAGSGFFYLWPGLPVDLPVAEPFARAAGFDPGDTTFDLRGSTESLVIGPEDRAALERADVSLGRLRADEVEPFLSYLGREFGGEWWHDVRWWLAEGLDPAAFVVLRDRTGEIVGHARIHRPADRPIGPPLFWRRLRGPDAGGLGPIGVAARLRGRGLGRALLVGALTALRDDGSTDVVIDFTTLLGFYGPLGFRPWMTFRHATAPIGRVLVAAADTNRAATR